DLRVLARALRSRDLEQAEAEGRLPLSSDQLIRGAVVDPGVLAGLDGPVVERVLRFGALVERARPLLATGTAEQVPRELRDGTRWPSRLRAAVAAGGSAARNAHRDLDAL